MAHDPTGAQSRGLDDLVEFARACRAEWPGVVPWFRGHSKASFRLVPSAFRGFGGDESPGVESSRYHEFMLCAPTRHRSCPPNQDLAAWLFLMRHYGLPTRLLDWTLSPATAAFFAVWEDEDSDGEVLAIDPIALNRAAQCSGIIPATFEPRHVEFRNAFTGMRSGAVLAVNGQQADARHLAQSAMYTLHSRTEPLDSGPVPIRRFRIPAQAKPDLLNRLRLMGVRLSTLFPDLSHLSAELAES